MLYRARPVLEERRRRGRFLAWGVSPRYRATEESGALEGRQISPAARTAGHDGDVSIAATRLKTNNSVGGEEPQLGVRFVV